MAQQKQVHFVRLKPRMPGKGFKVGRYTFRGVLYTTKGGWYRIEDVKLLRELQALRQKVHDPDSPPLFDVCTEEQARQIEERERESKTSVASAVRRMPARSMVATEKPSRRPPSSTLSTADLAPTPRPKPPSQRAEEEPEDEGDVDENDPELTSDAGFEDDEEIGKIDVVADGADPDDADDDEPIGKIDSDDEPAPKEPKPAKKAEKKVAKPKPRTRR